MPTGAATALAVLGRAPGLARAAARARKIEALPGLSNATFRIDTTCGSFAVQIPVPAGTRDPARLEAIAATQLAHSLGIGAELIHAEEESGAIVTRWIPSAMPTTAERLRASPGAIMALAARFARLHASGARLIRRFDPFAAIADLTARAGADALPAGVAAALARAQAELALAPAPAVPIHGDPVPANVLGTSGAMVLIDWEYAGMGEPAWDLAYFALEAGLSPAEEAALAAAHGAPGLDARRLMLNRLTAAALAALWGAARMRVVPVPDLGGWIGLRRAQALALAAALETGGVERPR